MSNFWAKLLEANSVNFSHQAKEKIKADYFNDVYKKASDTEKEKTDGLVNGLFTKLNSELDNGYFY